LHDCKLYRTRGDYRHPSVICKASWRINSRGYSDGRFFGPNPIVQTVPLAVVSETPWVIIPERQPVIVTSVLWSALPLMVLSGWCWRRNSINRCTCPIIGRPGTTLHRFSSVD